MCLSVRALVVACLFGRQLYENEIDKLRFELSMKQSSMSLRKVAQQISEATMEATGNISETPQVRVKVVVVAAAAAAALCVGV